FGLGALRRMPGAPPPSRLNGRGQAGELLLTRDAAFHVPRQAVPFGRGQSVGQQAGECLVGGAGRHERAPRALGRKTNAGPLCAGFGRMLAASQGRATAVRAQELTSPIRVSGFLPGASSAPCSWPRTPWPLAFAPWRQPLRPAGPRAPPG